MYEEHRCFENESTSDSLPVASPKQNLGDYLVSLSGTRGRIIEVAVMQHK